MNSVHAEFEATVQALWARLGLAAPRFGEPGRVQLRVEKVSLDLLDDGRGALVVEGAVGDLAAAEAGRTRQTRRILETNLGLLLDNEAGIYVAQGPGGAATLTARASYRYKMDRVERLMKKIEDTIVLMEYYAPEMSDNSSATGRNPPAGLAMDEPAVIFRP